MVDEPKFGDRLRELREAAGITRYALAKLAGIPKQTVYKIEDGVNEPNWTTVLKLAEALGVDVSAFVVKPEVSEPDTAAPPPPEPPPAPKPRTRKKPAAGE